ncbi:MAG: hypothetical protein PVJ85_16525 [Anaerolineae bacterium]
MDTTIFLMLFRSATGERMARTVIDSLRAFGGPLGQSPVWAFGLEPGESPRPLSGYQGVQRLPLAVEAPYRGYPFAHKVAAMAQAEELAGPETGSLVWLGLDCLIIQPPRLFALDRSCDAAFRSVHHRNIGSPAHEPPDDFWAGLYRALGVEEVPHTIESFADGQTLRPYFNTHCFALNPATGIGRAWWEAFKGLVTDEAFQAGPCADELHQIFLHQAILSTLVVKLLAWDRIRLLPPTYNYPLNMHTEVPYERRPKSLNALINAVHEGVFPWGQIAIEEPLQSWVLQHLSPTADSDGGG